MKARRNAVLLALPTVMALVILFIAPMIWILIQALQKDGLTYFAKFFGDPFYLAILWNTVKIALQTTCITLLLGYPTAYFMARTQSGARNILMIVLIFPFLVSAVVRSYGWMVILGEHGLLNQFLVGLGLIAKPLVILNTPHAVRIGLVHLLLPYMVLSVSSVLQGIDRNVEYAAYSLGANPFKTFYKVVLPLSSPGVISGCVLVFTLSMTAYVTPKLLGGARFRVMSTMVFQEINVNFNWAFATAISYILLFAILVILILSNYATSGINKRVGGPKHA